MEQAVDSRALYFVGGSCMECSMFRALDGQQR